MLTVTVFEPVVVAEALELTRAEIASRTSWPGFKVKSSSTVTLRVLWFTTGSISFTTFAPPRFAVMASKPAGMASKIRVIVTALLVLFSISILKVMFCPGRTSCGLADLVTVRPDVVGVSVEVGVAGVPLVVAVGLGVVVGGVPEEVGDDDGVGPITRNSTSASLL